MSNEAKDKICVILTDCRGHRITGALKSGNDITHVSVDLKPGANFVPITDWNAVCAEDTGSTTPGLLEKLGLLEVKTPVSDADIEDAKASEAEDINSYTVKDAKVIIENVFDSEKLDEIEAANLAGQNRKGIKDALADQREKLESSDEAEDE